MFVQYIKLTYGVIYYIIKSQQNNGSAQRRQPLYTYEGELGTYIAAEPRRREYYTLFAPSLQEVEPTVVHNIHVHRVGIHLRDVLF